MTNNKPRTRRRCAADRRRWTRRRHQSNTQPRIIHLLDLSTAHLPPPECADLPSYDGVIAYPLSTTDEHYGWLLWVPNDPDAEAATYQIPAAVLAIQRHARHHDCDYVLLDRDAHTTPDLPTWNW